MLMLGHFVERETKLPQLSKRAGKYVLSGKHNTARRTCCQDPKSEDLKLLQCHTMIFNDITLIVSHLNSVLFILTVPS